MRRSYAARAGNASEDEDDDLAPGQRLQIKTIKKDIISVVERNESLRIYIEADGVPAIEKQEELEERMAKLAKERTTTNEELG